MSAPQSSARDDDEPAAIGLTRSSVWRQTVAAASLIGTGVVTKLLGDMMVKSLTEDSFLATLGRALSGLWLALLAVAAVFALYRWTESRREKRRAAREIELIQQLVPPGPIIYPPAHDCPQSAQDSDLGDLTGSYRELAAALRVLPFEEYDPAVLLAIVAAVAETAVPAPGAQDAVPEAVHALLRKLVDARVLHLGGRQGYCAGPRAAPSAQDRAAAEQSRAWRVTVSVLLHHWSELAGLWALGLNHSDLAEGARRWFEYRETFLYALAEEAARAGDKVPRDAIPAAARLVDALDVWQAAIGRPAYRVRVTGWMSQRLDDKRLAWMRAGRLNERPRYRSRFLVLPGRRARKLHRAALDDLVRVANSAPPGSAPAAGSFDPVVGKLTRVWWRLPRTDLSGEVCTAINLAITHILQGRYDAADDRLGLAESLAERGDPGGLAHTYEIRGCLYWARGESRQALSWWMRAFEAYQPLADGLGASRCRKHMGAALREAPQHAGVVWDIDRDGDPTLDRVRAKADAWVAEATELRAAVERLGSAIP
ncbi:tetratricopeptide repeat protein [Nocardia sp. NPDC051832]|uniref:tetratricopeptide repeat protein n=1 Tax=Nocardia sp. NPDC051832 TaxID=3155673 RepID=UPI00343D2B73